MLTGYKRALRDAMPPALAIRARSIRRSFPRPADPTLSSALGTGRCGEVMIRPLTRQDGPAWTASMRANHRRMASWWSVDDDPARATDRLEFEEQFQAWNRRLRRGAGVSLGLIAPEGLAGELQIWHLIPGGLTCEIGLWISPDISVPVKQAGGCLGYAFDRLFGELGIRRIDAPVAAGNRMPRALLSVGGFEVEASIAKWRELHGQLVDYDLFTLTPERWAAARPRARAALGEWGREPPDAPRTSMRAQSLWCPI